MIKVDALTRTYSKVFAVNNVSFEIGPREIVGLLGHNGAGKTTILKMLTGYLEPSAGTITINGRNVCDERQKIQEEIGYLPENSPLYPDMKVLDYLEYAASLRGVPAEKRQERIIYAIRKTRIVDVALKAVNTLSRGYRQRLGVAQAILNSPNILILDEPTNGLDPTQILEMRALIQELAETTTIIISTHILQEVHAICGRVIIINKGELALDAKLASLQVSNKLEVLIDKTLNEQSDILKRFELKISEHEQKRGHNNYTLEAQTGTLADIIPEFVQALVQDGCKVYAINPIERDLETVFREISSGGQVHLHSNKKTASSSTALSHTSEAAQLSPVGSGAQTTPISSKAESTSLDGTSTDSAALTGTAEPKSAAGISTSTSSDTPSNTPEPNGKTPEGSKADTTDSKESAQDVKQEVSAIGKDGKQQ